jgi:hypothetical protein
MCKYNTAIPIVCRYSVVASFETKTSITITITSIVRYTNSQVEALEKNTKAVPLAAWSGPEGSRRLRSTDFMTTAQDGGKVVSLTHRPPLPPGSTPGTHFC